MYANELLMSCPDDQITRMQIVWKATATAGGDWKEAAHHLHNAASEGETTWHERAFVLACEYEEKGEKCAA